MPTYTDPATGQRITSDAPLSDADLDEAFGGAPPEAAAPDPRMPLVTQPMAGEGVPPASPSLGSAPLRDPGFLESQPFEPGGPVERGQMGPAFYRASQMAAPFMLPGAGSMLGAAAMGAGYNAAAEGVDQLLAGKEPNWQDIGKASLYGGVAGAVTHGATNLIFGIPQPARREAERVLEIGPLGPVPASVTGKQDYAQHAEQILDDALPPASRQVVDTAYNDFRATVGPRSIDVTAYNQRLAHYAAVRFPNERLPVPARLLDPVGRPVQIPGQPVRWTASADELLASERGIGFAARGKTATGQPTLPGGLMRTLQGDLSGALRGALTPAEQEAYGAARTAARELAQRESAQRLLTSKLVQDGDAVNLRGLASALERQPEKFRQRLGGPLYDEVLTIAQAGRTLLTQPGGRVLFSQILGRMPFAAAGAVVGGEVGGPMGYGMQGRVAGALTFGAAGPSLLSPSILGALEHLARTRATAGAVAEGAGRLAVALAMEDEPNPRQGSPSPAPLPFAMATPTPQPLGRVGAP